MPTEPSPATLSEVVQRAAAVIDPEGADPDVTEFLQRFEDADEPITAIADIAERMNEEAGALDPQEENGPIQLTAAVATYLAFRRDEIADDPDEIVRLAVRAEFDGNPPTVVDDWLSMNGIEV